MSFSGFVFDMIRRNKENRDLLTLRRERMKDLQGKMYRKGTLQNPNVTLEELEKIEKATREKEKAETQYYLRATLIFLTWHSYSGGYCSIVPALENRRFHIRYRSPPHTFIQPIMNTKTYPWLRTAASVKR